jgi:hypothetical protein
LADEIRRVRAWEATVKPVIEEVFIIGVGQLPTTLPPLAKHCSSDNVMQTSAESRQLYPLTLELEPVVVPELDDPLAVVLELELVVVLELDPVVLELDPVALEDDPVVLEEDVVDELDLGYVGAVVGQAPSAGQAMLAQKRLEPFWQSLTLVLAFSSLEYIVQQAPFSSSAQAQHPKATSLGSLPPIQLVQSSSS